MDIQISSDDLNFILEKAELENETCHLKHSNEDPAENHPAVEYLCQRLGNKKTDTVYQEIRVPVCLECAEAIDNPKWILMYCVFCFKSQWVYRPFAKYYYPPGNLIYWLDVCPFCAEIVNEAKE
jgi:hypothetical protein